MVLVFVNCLKMASTLLVFFCITVELAFSSGGSLALSFLACIVELII